MHTPSEFVKNLKNNVITPDMLSFATYSVSKRAKHHRDMARNYREESLKRYYYNHYYYDKYDNAQKSEKKKDFYYKQKELFLSLMQPTGIHTSTHYKDIQAYEGENLYTQYKEKDPSAIVSEEKITRYHFRGYVSYWDDDDYIVRKDKRVVDEDDYYRLSRANYLLGDPYKSEQTTRITVKVPDVYDVYLYYECGDYTFHSPVCMGESRRVQQKKLREVKAKYRDLKITELDDLFVPSADLDDILSAQFTTKMAELVKSGNYTLKSA